jgi:prolyl-tRNA editing enzyme YbaK/EbsC (Cys-tRNA(Pro) deacylase)
MSLASRIPFTSTKDPCVPWSRLRTKGDHSHILVLVAGPAKVSWSSLRKYLGVRRLTTANDSEVQDVTGFVPGAVSPVGLKRSMRILADQGLKDQQIVSIGAGIRNAGIILRTEDLLRSIEVEFVDITEA